jgi:hypothetical protein
MEDLDALLGQAAELVKQEALLLRLARPQ